MSPLRAAPLRLAAAVGLAVASAAGCGTPAPAEYGERIARAQSGLEGDPELQARREQVEAARARERGEGPFDELEVRVRHQNEEQDSLRVLTRVPLPDPRELSAQRAARRAETEASLARLEETALERRGELCFRAIEEAVHRHESAVYREYSERQAGLLEWNREWRESGALSEPSAIRFEIESRIKLATRMPEPAPPTPAEVAALPEIGRADGMLIRDPELVRETVREHHPAVGVSEAVAERYRALARRAVARGRPRVDFVDLSYEPLTQRDRHEFAAQLAVRVPLGRSAKAEAARYTALARGEGREAAQVVEEQLRLGMVALGDVDHFEANTERWLELLDLAGEAEALAERWWRQRLATPSDVSRLLDQAFAARASVLEARARAGLAGCTLFSMTGVSIEDWPRGSGAAMPR